MENIDCNRFFVGRGCHRNYDLTFLLPILEEEWNLTTAQSGTIGSAYFAGELIGALLVANLSDRIGRTKCIIVSNVFQIIFGMLSAVSTEMYFMTFTRFIVTFCDMKSNRFL